MRIFSVATVSTIEWVQNGSGDREVRRERIAARAEAMLKAGVPVTAKSLLSVGYKECMATLSGLHPENTLMERIAQATAKLAKQQRTWFRGETGVQWLKPDYWEELKTSLLL